MISKWFCMRCIGALLIAISCTIAVTATPAIQNVNANATLHVPATSTLVIKGVVKDAVTNRPISNAIVRAWLCIASRSGSIPRVAPTTQMLFDVLKPNKTRSAPDGTFYLSGSINTRMIITAFVERGIAIGSRSSLKLQLNVTATAMGYRVEHKALSINLAGSPVQELNLSFALRRAPMLTLRFAVSRSKELKSIGDTAIVLWTMTIPAWQLNATLMPESILDALGAGEQGSVRWTNMFMTLSTVTQHQIYRGRRISVPFPIQHGFADLIIIAPGLGYGLIRAITSERVARVKNIDVHLRPGCSIRGRALLKRNGVRTPAAKCRIIIAMWLGEASGGASGAQFAMGRTGQLRVLELMELQADENGKFNAIGLPPGNYVLYAHGYPYQRVGVTLSDAHPVANVKLTINLTNGQPRHIEQFAQRSLAAVRGRVVTIAGAGISNAFVVLLPVNATNIPGIVWRIYFNAALGALTRKLRMLSAVADANGYFQLIAPMGQYAMVVGALGFRPRLIRDVKVARELIAIGNVVLQRDPSLLLPLRIYRNDGTPLCDVVTVTLLKRGEPSPWRGVCQTNRDGELLLPMPGEGQYTIIVDWRNISRVTAQIQIQRNRPNRPMMMQLQLLATPRRNRD